MDQLKICPILGTGPLDVNTNCKGERCAWYIRGGCVLVDIADSLAEIAMDAAMQE